MSGETRDAMMVVLVGCAQLRTPIRREDVFFYQRGALPLEEREQKDDIVYGQENKKPGETLFFVYIS